MQVAYNTVAVISCELQILFPVPLRPSGEAQTLKKKTLVQNKNVNKRPVLIFYTSPSSNISYPPFPAKFNPEKKKTLINNKICKSNKKIKY
jgi:hypothetical protein